MTRQFKYRDSDEDDPQEWSEWHDLYPTKVFTDYCDYRFRDKPLLQDGVYIKASPHTLAAIGTVYSRVSGSWYKTTETGNAHANSSVTDDWIVGNGYKRHVEA